MSRISIVSCIAAVALGLLGCSEELAQEDADSAALAPDMGTVTSSPSNESGGTMEVKPGAWTTDYSTALSLAKAEGVPLIAFLHRKGAKVAHEAVADPLFLKWFEGSGIYLVDVRVGHGWATPVSESALAQIRRLKKVSDKKTVFFVYWAPPGGRDVKVSFRVDPSPRPDDVLVSALTSFDTELSAYVSRIPGRPTLEALLQKAYGAARDLPGLTVSPADLKSVHPEVWTDLFYAALTKARQDHRPLLIIDKSETCVFCMRLQETMDSKTFERWAQGSGIYLVNGVKPTVGREKEARDASRFARAGEYKWKGIPQVGLYWPKADGTSVFVDFIGRRGRMPGELGGPLVKEFITALQKPLREYLVTVPDRKGLDNGALELLDDSVEPDDDDHGEEEAPQDEGEG